MERLRLAGHDPRTFRSSNALPWLAGGGGLVLLLTVVPLWRPTLSAAAEQLSTALALLFFVVAVATWFGMGARALVVGLALVAVLYGLAGLTALLQVQDVFFLAILVGLAIFILAGFNLIFVLEEMVYDAHRLLHLRAPQWSLVPVAVVVAVLVLLPLAEDAVGFPLATLRTMAIGSAFLLGATWGVRAALKGRGRAITREADLLVAGAMAGGLLADVVTLLRQTGDLVPSLFAYLVILGTWLFISFTTLQRTQYFIRGRDTVPWVALLLSSSFAVVAHVHEQFRLSGQAGLGDLVNVRVGYIVLGIWIGIAFFVLRGVWRLLVYLRDERRLGGRTRAVAGRLARLAEGALTTEQRMKGVTFRVLYTLDRALPGAPRPPHRPVQRPLDERQGAPFALHEGADGGGDLGTPHRLSADDSEE